MISISKGSSLLLKIKIATKLVGQIGFHQNGVPIELQQSGYISNVSYLISFVNSLDNDNKKFRKYHS